MMKRFLHYFCWSLLFALGISTAKADALTELTSRLASFSTYQADFSQKTLDEQDQLLQTASGRVTIKRPGQFRWHVLKPSQQLLMTNGKIFWLYDVDLAQATQQSLSQKVGMDPALLLSGSTEKIAANFNVTGLLEGRDSTSFLLTPKNPDYGFKKVILTFQEKKLIKMIVENNLSQTSIFNFTQIQLNQPLSDDLFNFSAPDGVDLVVG